MQLMVAWAKAYCMLWLMHQVAGLLPPLAVALLKQGSLTSPLHLVLCFAYKSEVLIANPGNTCHQPLKQVMRQAWVVHSPGFTLAHFFPCKKWSPFAKAVPVICRVSSSTLRQWAIDVTPGSSWSTFQPAWKLCSMYFSILQIPH